MRAPDTVPTLPGWTLVAAAEEFAVGLASEVSALPDGDLIASLDEIAQARRSLEAAALVLTAELSERSRGSGRESLAHRLGDRTPAEVVARALGLEGTAASDLVTVADAVTARRSLLGERLPAALPSLAEAIADGAISISCGATLTRTLHTVRDALDDESRDALARQLIDSAADLTPREFRRLCREVPTVLLPEDEETRERVLRDAVSLTIAQRPDGLTRFVLIADPESAGLLTAALDARTSPQREVAFRDGAPNSDAGPDADADADSDPDADSDADADAADPLLDPALAGPRPLRQRRADALVDLAREALAHDDGSIAGVAVTMLVTVSLETLRSGLGAASISGVDEPICAATARRLAADAELIPVVLGAAGEILDLGRSRRLFTPAQRRALAVRDGGCIWPGCHTPPGWCEVAHVEPWALGGRTDLANGALLCRFHHRRFDQDGWKLDHRDGERWLIPPPWIDTSMRPRRIHPRPRQRTHTTTRTAA